MTQVFDLAVIGGGINGCGCAADAALRQLSVVLIEQDDLASKTSSSSTKLIHGGLRYLEHYEFSLVKKALEERQILLNIAPHLVHPQAFILPYQQHMRAAWFLRLGLFLYDHLSKNNTLPHCQSMWRKNETSYFEPLKESLDKGFLFYDAATDDARLTISNALQAKKYGASIRPYSKLIAAHVHDNLWHLTIQPQQGKPYLIRAKALINATGPWVNETAKLTKTALKQEIALVKGSHILVPPIYKGPQAYFLQHEDNRIIFVIPYHGYSMIGTTDIPLTESLTHFHIDPQEIDYLITLVNFYFKKQLQATDIVHSWSGIRPLIASKNHSASTLSRDYSYEFTTVPAPVLTIMGGKITTYRQLAKEVIDQLKPLFPHLKETITMRTPLPGATLDAMSFEEYTQYAHQQYHWLDKNLLHRYLYSYGTITESFLAPCTNHSSMGKKYSAQLYQVELDYLISQEWAKDSESILYRRTKLGLEMSKEKQHEIDEYLVSSA